MADGVEASGERKYIVCNADEAIPALLPIA